MDNKNDVTERIKERFIICYDKFTRPIALSLRNSITKANESCVIWTEKVYNDNEYKLTNHNLKVLFSEKMIEEHLANPAIKTVYFSEGVILKHEGNTMGIMIDPLLDYEKVKNENKRKRWALNLIPFIGGVIYEDRECKMINELRTRLLFDAVEKLKAETIEKFLRGELD